MIVASAAEVTDGPGFIEQTEQRAGVSGGAVELAPQALPAAGGAGEELAGQRAEGERLDEFGRVARHRHAHMMPGLRQFAHNIAGFVNRDRRAHYRG